MTRRKAPAFTEPIPTWQGARDAVQHRVGGQEGYTHADPAGVCGVRRHRWWHSAVACERTSQLTAWRRRRALAYGD